MGINELRKAFFDLGFEVMNFKNEKTFRLRKHGSIEELETIYNLEMLEEKYFMLKED